MSFEQKVNQQLNKYPVVKKRVKSVYQHTMYAISSKKDHEGNIVRLSPDDPMHEYFFGYYDKSPWDVTGRYMLCLKAKDTWSSVAPNEPADILLIDTEKENEILKLQQHIRGMFNKDAWHSGWDQNMIRKLSTMISEMVSLFQLC